MNLKKKKELDLCITCKTPIGEGETIHTIDSRESLPSFVLVEKELRKNDFPIDFFFQCDWCYQEFKKETVSLSGLPKIWNMVIFNLLFIIDTVIMIFLVKRLLSC
jgi:hypothetical protein